MNEKDFKVLSKNYCVEILKNVEKRTNKHNIIKRDFIGVQNFLIRCLNILSLPENNLNRINNKDILPKNTIDYNIFYETKKQFTDDKLYTITKKAINEYLK